MAVHLKVHLAVWEGVSKDTPSHICFYGCSSGLNKGHLKSLVLANSCPWRALLG